MWWTVGRRAEGGAKQKMSREVRAPLEKSIGSCTRTGSEPFGASGGGYKALKMSTARRTTATTLARLQSTGVTSKMRPATTQNTQKTLLPPRIVSAEAILRRRHADTALTDAAAVRRWAEGSRAYATAAGGTDGPSTSGKSRIEELEEEMRRRREGTSGQTGQGEPPRGQKSVMQAFKGASPSSVSLKGAEMMPRAAINPTSRLLFFLCFGGFAALGLYATDEIVPRLPEKKPGGSPRDSIVGRSRMQRPTTESSSSSTPGDDAPRPT